MRSRGKEAQVSEERCAQLGFVLLALTVVVLFIVTHQRDTFQQEAVERGHAEYVVDSDGETTWQWKEAAMTNKQKQINKP